MTDLLFVTGQIRALETRLLTINRLDRMIGAKTPHEAFRILIELQYADYIDEEAKAEDFDRIIEQGLLETKELLMRETENNPGLQFLWLPADINNLKRAFKLKLLDKKSSLEHFSQTHGFSLLGNLDQSDVENIVWNSVIPEEFLNYLGDNFGEQLQYIESQWQDDQNFSKIEFFLDQLYFEILYTIVQKSGNRFLKDLFLLLVDITNFKSLTRSVLMREEPLKKECFIPLGTLTWTECAEVSSKDQLLKVRLFSSVFANISDQDSSEELVLTIERQLDKIYDQFLHEGQSGEINSIQVPLSYMHRRIQNAKMLKFIMFSKFHGIPTETIYEKIRAF